MKKQNNDYVKRILGQDDPRSMVGKLARGSNVYNGGSSAAHSGGGLQYGRPKKNPIAAAASAKSNPNSLMATSAAKTGHQDTFKDAVNRRMNARRMQNG